MNLITISTFEKVVARYFEPIAKKYDWPIVRESERIFTVTSPYFVMRVHFGVGHGNSVSATLKPIDQTAESGANRKEFGVAVIAGFNGYDMQTRPVSTIDEFSGQAQYVSEMAEKFCVPYLQGLKPASDFDAIRVFIDQKGEKELNQIKNYKFPPPVPKRWHLPPPQSLSDKSKK